jgi:hypothetical protein
MACPAAAQLAAGSVEGTARDAVHDVLLPDVTIVVQNEGTGLRRSTTTGPNGRYQIGGLPTEGTYTIQATLEGFTPVLRQKLTLISNETIVVNFTLQLRTEQEITVVAPVAVLDPGRSTVQQTVNEQLVRTLPLFGRDFIHLASLAAGFNGNPNFPSSQGQIYWTNNILVDGASHFSKWRSAARAFYSGYGLDSIKEVQVLANRFSAEFGETLATITSATTKAGTNVLGGSAMLFVQDDALDATPQFALRKPPAKSAQFGFTLGGPIVRDRTHFFGSYDGRRSRNHNIVASPLAAGSAVPDNQDEHLVFVRVDHQLGQRQLITARYNGQFFRWHNELGGLDLPGSGTAYTNDVHTLLFSDSSQVSTRLLNELRFQFARYVDTRLDLQPTVFVSRAGYSQEGGALGPLGFGANPEDTWEAADALSFSRGAAALKLGGGFRHVGAHNTVLNYGRGAYFFGGSPDLFPTPFLFIQALAPNEGAATADPRSLSAFGFAQADWKFHPRLTLNLGLRYDVETVRNVRNYLVAADKNNFQPRLGVAWDPNGQGRMVVRGGVGLYTQQQLLFYINRVQLEGPDGTITLALPPGSSLFPTFPNALPGFLPGSVLPPRDIQRADPAFHNPYSIQATGGFEQTLFGNLVVAADYVYLNGRSLVSLTDANAPASNVKPAARSVADADRTRPLAPVPTGYRKIITLGNLGESWYHALQIRATRSMGRLQTMAAYTLSHAEDMANYQLPEDSRNIGAEKGRADNDVTHNLTAAITWDLPFDGRFLGGWAISGIGSFRSNRPYTITWGDDRNGTTQNDARPDGRNTGKTEPFFNVDLAVVRRFRFGTTTIEARVEAFNAFNTTNFDEYVGTLSSPLYAKPVSAFPKERLQLAAILRF